MNSAGCRCTSSSAVALVTPRLTSSATREGGIRLFRSQAGLPEAVAGAAAFWISRTFQLLPSLGKRSLPGSGSRNPDRFQLLDGGYEIAFEVGRAFVVAAKADMLMGKFFKIKRPIRLVVKPLVKEAIHPLGGGIAQAHAQIIIQRLQVSGLKALENILAPNDVGRDQLELFAGRPAIIKFKLINDVETLRWSKFSCGCPAMRFRTAR